MSRDVPDTKSKITQECQVAKRSAGLEKGRPSNGGLIRKIPTQKGATDVEYAYLRINDEGMMIQD